MSGTFAVVIDGMTVQAVFGPFADRAEAGWFAEFATAEIDPARVVPLRSPATELPGWRDMIKKEAGE